MNKVKVGTDLVDISKFEESLKRGGETFLNHIFTQKELNSWKSIESMAGLFAGKEAVIKALNEKPGRWLEIEFKKTGGKPILTLSKSLASTYPFSSFDISISHTGSFAIAVAVFILQ